MQPYRQDGQDTHREERRHTAGPCASVHRAQGIDQRVLIHTCRPKTPPCQDVGSDGSTFLVSYQTKPLSIRHKMQTTRHWEARRYRREVPAPLVRASFGYLSRPKPQHRYPHRKFCSPPNATPVICSPGPRVGAQGGQPSTQASSYPTLPSFPPLPETQLLLQRPSGPV